MKAFIRRFSFMAILLLSSMVQADDFGQALQQLAQKSVVRAQFEQSKHIAHANKPMLSRGQLLFVRNQGVLWQLTAPVQANLVVTPRKMVQKTAHTQSVVNLKQTPYGPAANVLLQLLSGNESALRQHFTIGQFKQNAQSWQATLVPKSALMKPLFSRIDVQSQQGYVKQLTLLDANARSTVIVFSQHATTPTALSAHEKALFQLAQ